jgi:hypothetical protein
MNRFSSDIDILDDRVPRTFRLWAIMLSTLFSILVVISVNTPSFLIAIVPVGILYVLILVRSTFIFHQFMFLLKNLEKIGNYFRILNGYFLQRQTFRIIQSIIVLSLLH